MSQVFESERYEREGERERERGGGGGGRLKATNVRLSEQ